jgi:cytochrome c oxidase subunit 2
MTSQDVLHSWWVPELGIKKDTIPGFINETWVIVDEPGVYRGQCAELCGVDHGFMPIEVHAMEPAEYREWYAGQQEVARQEAELADAELTMEEAMETGERVYGTNCVTCHQADGSGMPPSFPALAGSDVATGEAGGTSETVVNGVPGTAMAAYGRQLNMVDLASVITYVRNSFGNNSGDIVQPADVNEIMQEGQ